MMLWKIYLVIASESDDSDITKKPRKLAHQLPCDSESDSESSDDIPKLEEPCESKGMKYHLI